MARVRIDGKHFAVGDQRFPFRGVTYGTFRPRRHDDARFPEFEDVKRDFVAIQEAGFSVLRTYTVPPDDVVELASDWGLRLVAGVFYPDWRYLLGSSRRDRSRMASQARREVRTAARRLSGNETVLAVCVGNEVPADVVRWVGTDIVAATLSELAEVVREEDPDLLVTYANYPTTEYLQVEHLDFLTFNVFLEQQDDFRRYVARLQNLAGGRPLVLGETGLDAGNSAVGEEAQARTVDWLLETAVEQGVAGTCLFSWTDEWWVGDNPVEGWHFGLTRADRSERPSLRAALEWNRRTVADLRPTWPSISVVTCAYNAGATLDECLRHTCDLDYPSLEVIVVDDGSADDTAEIARRHPRVRLVEIDHGGLSVARNVGYRAATGDLVAYLDSDAYPTPEWPYYLALAMEDPAVGAAGGPNVPPHNDPLGAQKVAQAPGGPVHVLTADDRAEHVPGCNLVVRRQVLEELGAFDPAYVTAGDDVDLCWRILDHGWQIGFHPAALVWHHRRDGLAAYLRQQAGYGRAEALVAARHPHRFTGLGAARWRGRVYNPLIPTISRPRIYRGPYGSAAYQSIYSGPGHALDIAHQLGVPLAWLAALSGPLALLRPALGLPALVALGGLIFLGAIDATRARPPAGARGRAGRFRLGVALLHLLQPLARTWARTRFLSRAGRQAPAPPPLARSPRELSGGTLLWDEDRPRPELAAAIASALRRCGVPVTAATAWEDHDGRLAGSALVAGELLTSSHPDGSVQVRIRPRLRRGVAAGAASALAVAAVVSQPAVPLLLAVAGVEAGRGWWRVGPKARRIILSATAAPRS